MLTGAKQAHAGTGRQDALPLDDVSRPPLRAPIHKRSSAGTAALPRTVAQIATLLAPPWPTIAMSSRRAAPAAGRIAFNKQGMFRHHPEPGALSFSPFRGALDAAAGRS